MCKNEYEVKMQAMELMSAAVNDVVCAMDGQVLTVCSGTASRGRLTG